MLTTAAAIVVSMTIAPATVEQRQVDAQQRAQWSRLDAALAKRAARGELSELARELEEVFGSADPAMAQLGLAWIGRNQGAFTLEEESALYDVFARARPEDPMVVRLRERLALRRLAATSKANRAKVYWDAVQRGRARVPGGPALARTTALGMAAADGLEEFETAIQAYAKDLNATILHKGYTETDYWLWILRLRSGASDREQAVQKHMDRLVEMDSAQFASQMDSDLAFREAAINTAAAACGSMSHSGCPQVRRLVARQRTLDAERRNVGEAVDRQTRSAEVEPPWLGRLSGLAGYGDQNGSSNGP